MKRLLSSKAGFGFLCLSFTLLFLLVFGVSWFAMACVGTMCLAIDSGAIGVCIADDFSFPTLDLDRVNDWSWDVALLPSMLFREVWIPIWMLLVPSVCVSWFLYRRAGRKRLNGHCPKCEYDLTGNVSGACPECGEPI